MAKKKSGRGGAREGAGRPNEVGASPSYLNIRIGEKHRDTLDEIVADYGLRGRPAAVRLLIDLYRITRSRTF